MAATVLGQINGSLKKCIFIFTFLFRDVFERTEKFIVVSYPCLSFYVMLFKCILVINIAIYRKKIQVFLNLGFIFVTVHSDFDCTDLGNTNLTQLET